MNWPYQFKSLFNIRYYEWNFQLKWYNLSQNIWIGLKIVSHCNYWRHAANPSKINNIITFNRLNSSWNCIGTHARRQCNFTNEARERSNAKKIKIIEPITKPMNDSQCLLNHFTIVQKIFFKKRRKIVLKSVEKNHDENKKCTTFWSEPKMKWDLRFGTTACCFDFVIEIDWAKKKTKLYVMMIFFRLWLLLVLCIDGALIILHLRLQ